VTLAPVMKPDWKEMRVERLCRGTRIRMTVRNPQGAQAGVREIRADGKLLESPFLSWDWLRGREQVEIEVTLGGGQ